MNYPNHLERQGSFLRKNKYLILIVLTFLLVLSSANAQEDIEVKLSKENYEVGETIQLELIFSQAPLRNFDISLVKEPHEIPIGAITIKLTDKRYFIYFDIPQNIEKGNYKVKIDNVIFLVEGDLVETFAEGNLFINNVNPAFYWIKEQKKDTTEEILFSTLSLANAGLNPSQSIFLEEQDILGCFPKENCNVKDTALGLIALNKLNLDTTKTLNWLKGAQNDISLGSFKISITSTNNTCQINQDVFDINGVEEIITEEETVSVNCSSQPSNIKLIHTYLGNSYELESTNEKEITFNINNEGCFGIEYKSDCDYESSLYATYAFKELNQDMQKSLTWLQQNYDEFETLHHAFLNLIEDFSYSREWLINNQKTNGAWSKKALSIDETEDLFTTSIASESLKLTAYGKKGSDWLKDQENLNNWENNLELTSRILFFAFQEDKVGISLAINPGVLAVFKDQKDQVRLTLSNKGNTEIEANIKTPQEITVDKNLITLNPLESKNIFLTINTDAIKESSIEITYENKSYTVPILVSDELLSYITNPLRFVSEKSSVSFSIRSKETKEGDIKFKNYGSEILTDVKLELSGNLKDIITLETKSFSKIDINETIEVFTRINKNKDAKESNYLGNLTLTSKEGYISSLTMEVVITDLEGIPTMPLSESLEGFETEVTEEEREKPTPVIPPKKKSILPTILIIISIIIVILVILLIIKKKRGKKPKKVEVNFPKPTESERFKEHLKKLEDLKK